MRKIIAFTLCVGALLPTSVFAMTGTVLSTHKYAWSNNVGYINFENVIITDSELSGFAWATNSSFIMFSPTQGGVANDGNGNLSGSAWGEHLGWIDFDGVAIGTEGVFTGTATGELIGTLTFDCPLYCDVETDWRPNSISTTLNGGGPGDDRNDARIPIPTLPIVDSILSPRARGIDVVQDGIIDIFDFNMMMINWGNTTCGHVADMDNDCVVGIFDFNILMVYWGVHYTL